ncbi:MAG: beta-ketoacyl synthase N-terminal-like domain-containing protein [Syntrophales bacterium]|nr:beta-ketoacyl synthase N-terminal-like domain-containing protein [Syntrophales bacterium]
MRNRAMIKGRAIACALGEDLDAVVRGAREMRPGIARLPLTLAGMDEVRPYYLLSRRGPESLSAAPETFFYEVLFDTVERALADASLRTADLRDLAIFFGSTAIDIPVYEHAYGQILRETSRPASMVSSGYGRIADEVAGRFGIRGPTYTFTTACTSSANALLYAAAMIAAGRIPRALVIGYDLFSHLGFYGFESLRLIATDGYRPFDRRRSGIIMGEGCGAVVLEADDGGDAGAVLCGGANRVDAYNVTTHALEGGAIAQVMWDALEDADVEAGAVTAIKAHGTGSENNDRMEGNGMVRVFGDALPPFTVLKPLIGHTVGASGVVELILFTACLQRGFCPPTLGFEEADEALSLRPVTEPKPLSRGVFLLNFFGFGGNCTALVVAVRG